ncbi:hypothetical protein NQ315_002802 [Exocentrus adspersus]|uniref:Peptidase aspartic putative domain-containing protein n=1 Tax=Exocentrus adspersus TaxID=1586481 RepID=A0AAV8VK20_9CUCU|nr:hypothetical protein NQ315_002802 [Exocentrus adspersus]
MELKQLDFDVYEGLLTANCSEEDLLEEKKSCEDDDNKLIDLRIRYNNLISKQRIEEEVEARRSSTSSTSSNSRKGRRKFKLPVIEFKKFDGNIRDWLSFWAQFSKIDEDPDIDEADKIEYLIQATVSNSRARQLVESYPVVKENYNKIVEALKSRFGRDDIQIEVNYSCTLEVLDQLVICKNISHIFYGPWIADLHKLGVKLEDNIVGGPIEILMIGADVCEKLYTGKRYILDCGLVAVETLLGWTLSGRIPVSTPKVDVALSVISLHAQSSCVADLWKLDVLGIADPSDNVSQRKSFSSEGVFPSDRYIK